MTEPQAEPQISDEVVAATDEAASAHEFTMTISARRLNGVIVKDAGCTCGMKYDWADREARHVEHVNSVRLAAAVPLLRKQWEAERAERFHVPQIAEMHNGKWGVFCAACSAAVDDYMFPCRIDRTDWWANVPAHLLAQPGGQPE